MPTAYGNEEVKSGSQVGKLLKRKMIGGAFCMVRWPVDYYNWSRCALQTHVAPSGECPRFQPLGVLIRSESLPSSPSDQIGYNGERLINGFMVPIHKAIVAKDTV